VSRVSLVLAPLRLISARLVRKGCCANEDDRKALQTTSTIRQRLRTGTALGTKLNIESPGDREDALERIFLTSCDKKWRIASFPINNQTARGFPVNSTWNAGERTYTGKKVFNRTATIGCTFIPRKAVARQCHLLGRRKILHILHFSEWAIRGTQGLAPKIPPGIPPRSRVQWQPEAAATGRAPQGPRP
jgi:hypothetical protein